MLVTSDLFMPNPDVSSYDGFLQGPYDFVDPMGLRSWSVLLTGWFLVVPSLPGSSSRVGIAFQ